MYGVVPHGSQRSTVHLVNTHHTKMGINRVRSDIRRDLGTTVVSYTNQVAGSNHHLCWLHRLLGLNHRLGDRMCQHTLKWGHKKIHRWGHLNTELRNPATGTAVGVRTREDHIFERNSETVTTSVGIRQIFQGTVSTHQIHGHNTDTSLSIVNNQSLDIRGIHSTLRRGHESSVTSELGNGPVRNTTKAMVVTSKGGTQRQCGIDFGGTCTEASSLN
mmetsp:Transcript_3471/g.8339  ORF Transcript_3471/g.8339 Transcript_3471/m.8339 type:complete len:217 (-) Transcript_3471:102-752(-)